MAFAGYDPVEAPDWVWVGAYRIVDVIDDLHYVRNLLEKTAKESQKAAARPARRGGLGFRGRRR